MTEAANDETAGLVVDLRVAVGKLARRMREQTPGNDLTHSQSAVIALLDSNGPSTSTELARARGITPQSMGTIVNALLEDGYIVKTPDPRDGRKTLLSLSESTVQQVATGRLAKEDFLSNLIDTNFDDADRKQLREAITLLRRIADLP
jgi:DNA-binding MarR family transcriptional regulator